MYILIPCAAAAVASVIYSAAYVLQRWDIKKSDGVSAWDLLVFSMHVANVSLSAVAMAMGGVALARSIMLSRLPWCALFARVFLSEAFSVRHATVIVVVWGGALMCVFASILGNSNDHAIDVDVKLKSMTTVIFIGSLVSLSVSGVLSRWPAQEIRMLVASVSLLSATIVMMRLVTGAVADGDMWTAGILVAFVVLFDGIALSLRKLAFRAMSVNLVSVTCESVLFLSSMLVAGIVFDEYRAFELLHFGLMGTGGAIVASAASYNYYCELQHAKNAKLQSVTSVI